MSSMNDITALENDLYTLEKKYKENRRDIEKKIIDSKKRMISKEEEQVATLLHSCSCHSNHEAECDWYLDRGDWSSYSRRDSLQKARKLLQCCSCGDILTVLSVGFNKSLI